MEVMKVTEYNRLDLMAYDKAWKKWQDKGGFNSGDYHPQQAFYCFYNRFGDFRKTGYVARDGHKAVVRATKKQAIADLLK